MKYENYEQAGKIIESIKTEELLLQRLEDTDAVVKIEYKNGYTIMAIDAGHSSEHFYSKEAAEFVALIREDIQKRIDRFKAELMDL